MRSFQHQTPTACGTTKELLQAHTTPAHRHSPLDLQDSHRYGLSEPKILCLILCTLPNHTDSLELISRFVWS